MVTSLLADKTRVFQYVEFVYFRRWWLEQNATTQEQVGAYVGAREAQITPSRAHTRARACANLFLAFSLPLCATNTIPAAQVRGLVASKQLVFLTGGLCMNDEAVPFHGEIIDQMSWGHRFVNTTCCTVAAFVYLYSRLLSCVTVIVLYRGCFGLFLPSFALLRVTVIVLYRGCFVSQVHQHHVRSRRPANSGVANRCVWPLC